MSFEEFEAKTRKVVRQAYLADQIVDRVRELKADLENEKENSSLNCEENDSESSRDDSRAALATVNLNGADSNRFPNQDLTPFTQSSQDETSQSALSGDLTDRSGDLQLVELDVAQALNRDTNEGMNGDTNGGCQNVKKKRDSQAWLKKQEKKVQFRYADFFDSLPPFNTLPDREKDPKGFYNKLNEFIDAALPGSKHPITWEGIAVAICFKYPITLGDQLFRMRKFGCSAL